MIIDASDLIRKRITKKAIHIVSDGKSFNEADESIDFSTPIELNATLSILGDILSLEGTVTTVLKLTCSRCLEKFDYPISIEITEQFSNNRDDNTENIIFIDNEIFDITDVINNNILMSLPIKKLCKEDCKGLCQHCGTNLNFSTCKCKKEEIDPRLAKLKDLFSSN